MEHTRRQATEDERHIITESLRFAAERYDEDAKVMREGVTLIPNNPNYARLAEQFDRQAENARRLLDAMLNDEV